MKALIVDDELHVREAIRLLVDWEKIGIQAVLEAENVEQAKAIVKAEAPQVIMTDMMMPDGSGVELLEWLHTHSPRSKSIVISGHDDFQFVRNTMKYGGLDYILKPIDPEQIGVAVEAAAESWRHEERQREQTRIHAIELNQIKPVYWDKLFSDLISSPSSYEQAREALAQQFGLDNAVQNAQVAVLSLHMLPTELLRKFAGNRDLLLFSLLNIANEFLGERSGGGSGGGSGGTSGGSGYAFRLWSHEDELGILLWRGQAEAARILHAIMDGIDRTFGAKLDIGCGLPATFPRGLHESYRQALAALRTRNLLVRGSMVHMYGTPDSGTTTIADNAALAHFTSYAEDIKFAVLGGSESAIRKALGCWFAAIRELAVITPEQLELWKHEYAVLRAYWLNELVSEDEQLELIIPRDRNGRLLLDDWEEQLAVQLIALSVKAAARKHQEGSVIHDIAKYIEVNFQKELTLQEIAGHFYLSREYISRKFKQEFGENLSDYLTRIRVDKARLLLANPALRIADISEMVGYQDEKYFSKVFKKATGITPGDYRKQQKR